MLQLCYQTENPYFLNVHVYDGAVTGYHIWVQYWKKKTINDDPNELCFAIFFIKSTHVVVAFLLRLGADA